MALLFGVLGCGQVSHGQSPFSEDASPMGGATAGAAGASEAGMSNGGAAPPSDFSGRWSLIGGIDPVGVSLEQTGERLVGRGCVAGAPPLELQHIAGNCGPISGSVKGNTAHFSFDFDFEDGGTYVADVTLSTRADRMTGPVTGEVFGEPLAFRWGLTWLPVPDGQPSAQSGDPLMSLPEYDGAYQLTLDDSSGGDVYLPGESYAFNLRQGEIAGNLGVFWGSEMKSDGSTLEVGPVSETEPQLPVALRVEGDGSTVTRVSATLGSGAWYRFSAGTPVR